ncbi:hypothetical protein GCM10023159_08710 [Brevibacterium yomogidense]
MQRDDVGTAGDPQIAEHEVHGIAVEAIHRDEVPRHLPHHLPERLRVDDAFEPGGRTRQEIIDELAELLLSLRGEILSRRALISYEPSIHRSVSASTSVCRILSVQQKTSEF